MSKEDGQQVVGCTLLKNWQNFELKINKRINKKDRDTSAISLDEDFWVTVKRAKETYPNKVAAPQLSPLLSIFLDSVPRPPG